MEKNTSEANEKKKQKKKKEDNYNETTNRNNDNENRSNNSIVKRLNGYLLTRKVKHQHLAKVPSFWGRKSVV